MTYTKQEWIDQQTVISAARMDHIEGGIEAAHGLAEGLDTRLTTAEGQGDSLDTRLTAAEGDITALEATSSTLDTRLTAAEGDVTSLDAAVAALPQVQAGRVVITPTANTPTSAEVTFPVAFRAVPEMTASALSSVPGTVTEITVDAITTTGARIWMHRTSAITTSVSWIAVAV